MRMEPRLEGLEAELGWSLHRVMTAYRLAATDTVADLPGRDRGYALLVAVEHGPPSSQLALAHRLAINKTAVTYLVDDLEQAGLVTRRPDPADRRMRQVLATPHGRATLEHTRRRLREVEEQLLGALDPVAAEQLRASLVTVARSVADAVRPHDTSTPVRAFRNQGDSDTGLRGAGAGSSAATRASPGA